MSTARVSGGTINVSEGGSAEGIVMTGGSFAVSSGGRADDVRLDSGGYLHVSQGGVVSGAELTGFNGRAYIFGAPDEGVSGGFINEVTVILVSPQNLPIPLQDQDRVLRDNPLREKAGLLL